MRNLSLAMAIATVLTTTACSQPMGPPAGQRLNASSEKTPVSASLPFKTVLDDGTGSGRFFAAGESERAVLNNKADLEAFLQRHPRSQPRGNPANPSPPVEPFPPSLLDVDFGRYQLIAFFDGQVKLGATSRITAVKAQGDGLVVETLRWEPPPNPNSADDPAGRVHMVALPRQAKALSFAQTAVSHETSNTGAGTSVAGNPVMQPRWKAVPNPEVSQAMVDQQVQAQFAQASVTRLSVEKQTLSWVTQNLGPDYGKAMPFTEDSEVWVVIVEGDLPFPGPSAIGHGVVGAGEPRATRIVQLVSIEDGRAWETSAKPASTEPGMRFELRPQAPVYLGDALHFEVFGKPVEGALKLSLTVGEQGAPLEREIAYKDLGAFRLPLDRATVPSLAEDPVQRLRVKLTYGHATEEHTIDLIRDRDVQFTPPLRAAGPGNPGAYGAAQGQAALDAFARDMASTDWKGQNLSLTSQVVSRAELNLPSPQWDALPTNVVLHKFTVRGQFPKYLLPEYVTTTGKSEVFAPKRLEIVLSDSTPIHVVATKAFPD